MHKHQIEIRVCYGDTDAGGVVYHGAYLRMLELARLEFMLDREFNIAELYNERGLQFALRSIKVDYLAPARLADKLVIITCITQLKKVTIYFEQQIKLMDKIILTAELKLASVDKDLNLSPLPNDIRKKLV